MFLKITRSGPRQYLQLVEAFRDDARKAKHRSLVTLGRLDQLTDRMHRLAQYVEATVLRESPVTMVM
jgi:hypothetical protein